MRLLIDGDEANNNGNWQWIASVGVDPQPFFRRIYNPARHMERYDPGGRYVRRYVPELRGVPDRYLAEPWTMPEEVQRECRLRDRAWTTRSRSWTTARRARRPSSATGSSELVQPALAAPLKHRAFVDTGRMSIEIKNGHPESGAHADARADPR